MMGKGKIVPKSIEVSMNQVALIPRKIGRPNLDVLFVLYTVL